MNFFQKHDQTGREVVIHTKPGRIVSLVPSQTELLFDLGVGPRVVGLTKFCIHPFHAASAATVIGGTKHINIERILALKPDLIIANKEENEPETIERLQNRVAVWVSDVHNVRSALEMIKDVGILTGERDRATEMVESIRTEFDKLPGSDKPIRAAYLIWKNPLMAAGGDTFISSMMNVCGFENVFSGHKRYPQTNTDDLAEQNPEVILLSTEPFPFKERDVRLIREEFPGRKVLLVDGEMFSWYGSRMILAADYFRKIKLMIS